MITRYQENDFYKIYDWGTPFDDLVFDIEGHCQGNLKVSLRFLNINSILTRDSERSENFTFGCGDPLVSDL